ncbi:MAG: VOC family protein [Candidatus Cloacimonetes bacterium]|nr:VOC family protein [Candidatus Cloacimonadota bacterium]
MDNTKIRSIAFATIYADDYEKNLDFYLNVMGLEKSFDMAKNSCFLKLGDENFGVYLEGGNKPNIIDSATTRSSIMFTVDSASALFAKLQAQNVELLHKEPQDMGEGDYWFMFKDPAGNILEILGGK